MDTKRVQDFSKSQPIVYAAYTATSECEPVWMRLDGCKRGLPCVSIGALWSSDCMTFLVRCDVGETVTVKIGDCEKTANAVYYDTPHGIVFSASELHRTKLYMGIVMPLSVEVLKGGERVSFVGCIALDRYEILLRSPRFFAPAEARYDVARDYYYPHDQSCISHGSVSVEGDRMRISDPASGAVPLYRIQINSESLPEPIFTTECSRVDFDLCFHAMPIYQRSYHTMKAEYGFSVLLTSPTARGSSYGNSVMLCFLNTDQGICVYSNDRKPNAIYAFLNTGKRVGDRFHVCLLEHNRSVEVLIDGCSIGVLTDARVGRSLGRYNNTEKANITPWDCGSRSICFIWQRTDHAIGENDDFSAAIDNVCGGLGGGASILSMLDIPSMLSVTPCADTDLFMVSKDLCLPTLLDCNDYEVKLSLAWQSSDETVLSSDGKLQNIGLAGRYVDLFLTVSYDGLVGETRKIPLFVQSQTPSMRVLAKRGDVDPLTGSGEPEDAPFCVDQDFNSVIYDMGDICEINRAELLGIEKKTRITQNFVSLYHSNDNQVYHPISRFSLLQKDGRLFFYNFEVKARYLKIHFTYGDKAVEGFGFRNSLQRMMCAYHSTDPLLAEGIFAGRRTFSVSNETNQAVYDRIVRKTLADLELSDDMLMGDKRDIRFRSEGRELPHYYKNGVFYVRVLEISANSSATVNVLYGNPSAQSVSDGAGTLEIEYGNKTETSIQAGTTWITTVEEMPDGSLIIIGIYNALPERLGIQRSFDGGRTWTAVEPVQYTTEYIPERDEVHDSGGFIVDRENNVVYFFCFHVVENLKKRTVKLLVSTDSGRTWEMRTLDNLPADMYYNTYSDGIKLSTYDGDGENVDYVFTFTTHKKYGVFSFSGTALYSRDNGKTWQLSESRINYPEDFDRKFETGIGEDTVVEKPDGTLVFYSRCQVDCAQHFAVSHSYDHGVTWEETIGFSNVYAAYTQPIIDRLNGRPILLWGGNTSLGAYQRFPFNLAYSDDGGEHFVGMQDISFQLNISNREFVRRLTNYEITNPDIVCFKRGGVDCAFILCMQGRFLIENVTDYLYLTKGAYDSFEQGLTEVDGWVSVSGARPTLTEVGATNGNYAMRLRSESMVSRSIPYLKKGEVFFDLFVSDLAGGLHFELQSAYHRDVAMTAPISLYADEEGRLWSIGSNQEKNNTGLCLHHGANTVSIRFDGDASEAVLSVGQVEKEIPFRKTVGDYICFAYFYSGNHTDVAVDDFAVIDER